MSSWPLSYNFPFVIFCTVSLTTNSIFITLLPATISFWFPNTFALSVILPVF